jgi:hypothetical protein
MYCPFAEMATEFQGWLVNVFDVLNDVVIGVNELICVNDCP